VTARYNEDTRATDVAFERDGSTMHVESASQWPQREAPSPVASIVDHVLARVMSFQPAR
jgi:hypothetical protein